MTNKKLVDWIYRLLTLLLIGAILAHFEIRYAPSQSELWLLLYLMFSLVPFLTIQLLALMLFMRLVKHKK